MVEQTDIESGDAGTSPDRTQVSTSLEITAASLSDVQFENEV